MKLCGGGSGAATIMKFWTVEVYAVLFLICVAAVSVRIICGGDEVSGSVLSGGSFEGDSGVNIECVGPGEFDPLVVL